MPTIGRLLSKFDYLWREKNLTNWALVWAALSIFIYVCFGGAPQSVDRPIWYRFFTAYILQNVPFLVAGLLCIRNGLSYRMPSGKKVWLLIGIALMAFLVGNLFFASWELLWNLNSTGSLGDPFFCVFYICLSWAIMLAIYNQRTRFKTAHWLISGAIAIYAVMGVLWIMQQPSTGIAVTIPAPEIVRQVPSSEIGNNSIDSATSTTPKLPNPTTTLATNTPAWVMFFDRIFKPYGQGLNIFYICCDVLLFTLATGLILAFWGRRFSSAWQVNAQAIICFYIADMWYAYAGNQIKDYQTGFALEVFWILGGIQFALASGIEFEYMVLQNWIQELKLKSESELEENEEYSVVSDDFRD